MCPVFLKIGDFVIYFYGVMAATGVFIAGFVFQKYALRRGLPAQEISSIIFWTVITGILGGRIAHVLTHATYYFNHPFEIIKIRNGGLGIQGAIITALIFLAFFCGRKKIAFLPTVDLLAFCAPLGQAFGRIGCFLNGCCYGKETVAFFGVQFPFLPYRVLPTQLYYAAMDLSLFAILWFIGRKKRPDGEFLGIYLTGFGLIRYTGDFLRGDLVPTPLDLTTTQLSGIGFFVVGSLWLYAVLRESYKEHVKETENGR